MVRTELPEDISEHLPQDITWPWICKLLSIPEYFNACYQRCLSLFRGEIPLDSLLYYTDLFETLEHTCPRVYKGSEQLSQLSEFAWIVSTFQCPTHHVAGRSVLYNIFNNEKVNRCFMSLKSPMMTVFATLERCYDDTYHQDRWDLITTNRIHYQWHDNCIIFDIFVGWMSNILMWISDMSNGQVLPPSRSLKWWFLDKHMSEIYVWQTLRLNFQLDHFKL